MTRFYPPTVDQFVEQTSQPKDGLLPVILFTKTQLEDGCSLPNKDTLPDHSILLAANYLGRVLCGEDPSEVFKSAWRLAALLAIEKGELVPNPSPEGKRRYVGAETDKKGRPVIQTEFDIAGTLIDSVHGCDEASIRSACLLVGYEEYEGRPFLLQEDRLLPDDNTLATICTMAQRCAHFRQQYGPVLYSNYEFSKEAKKHIRQPPRPNCITEDTLWLFVNTRARPTRKQILRLLVLYLTGLRYDPERFGRLTRLGMYNPRYNDVYTLPVSALPDEVCRRLDQSLFETTPPAT